MPESGCCVVILCGGQGVRLRPLTDRVPKGMVPVDGKPMLEHILHHFTRQGCMQFVLCIGYRGEVIRHHFTPPPPGASLLFSDAGEDAGMLQRLWQARPLLPSRVIVTYCDTFIDMEPSQLLAFHQQRGADVTLVTAPIRNPFGVVDADANGHVSRFVEKPLYDCFIGCFVLETAALDRLAGPLTTLPDGGGVVAFFQSLAAEGRLAAYRHLGLQINFNSVSEHREAEAALNRYHTCMEAMLRHDSFS